MQTLSSSFRSSLMSRILASSPFDDGTAENSTHCGLFQSHFALAEMQIGPAEQDVAGTTAHR